MSLRFETGQWCSYIELDLPGGETIDIGMLYDDESPEDETSIRLDSGCPFNEAGEWAEPIYLPVGSDTDTEVRRIIRELATKQRDRLNAILEAMD